MKNLVNIEVFHIETTDGGTFCHISFQDPNNIDNLNNGYDNIRVPLNLRPIQKSIRDNMLVDQSVKTYGTVVGNSFYDTIVKELQKKDNVIVVTRGGTDYPLKPSPEKLLDIKLVDDQENHKSKYHK